MPRLFTTQLQVIHKVRPEQHEAEFFGWLLNHLPLSLPLRPPLPLSPPFSSLVFFQRFCPWHRGRRKRRLRGGAYPRPLMSPCLCQSLVAIAVGDDLQPPLNAKLFARLFQVEADFSRCAIRTGGKFE